MSEHLVKQLQLQRIIDRWIENFKKIGKNNLNGAKIRARISSLKDTSLQFLDRHAALMKQIPEGARSSMEYFRDKAMDTTADNYQAALDYISECLEEIEPPVSPNTSLDISVLRAKSEFPLPYMPTIQLAPFDGNLANWESFRDRFTCNP